MRTRHGDIVQIAIKEAEVTIKDGKKQEKLHLPMGAKVVYKAGAQLKKGDEIAEF